MNTFLFAFAAVALVSLGGRDQLLVARLAERLGKSGVLLLVSAAASAISAGLMAIAGLAMALLVPGPAGDVLVAFGLLIAAVELAWNRAPKLPDEPTSSLFATLVVLLARQVGDAARFLVFALAASGSAWGAAAGGALAGFAVLAAGAMAGDDLARWPLRPPRLVLAAGLAFGGIAIVLDARGVVG